MLLTLSLVYARPALAHHPPTELPDILAGLPHLPGIVWIILLAVLGLLIVALIALFIIKGGKQKT
ncbi:MAG: hypothetical protein V3S39_01015 [Thermodesulfobacteriota bacterium]